MLSILALFITIAGAISIQSDTIVDVLSSSANFSTFIRSLQRSDLVDYLNELQNVTLLAPTNTAFARLGISLLPLNVSVLQRFIVDQPLQAKDVEGVQIYRSIDRLGSPFVPGIKVPILFDNEGDGDLVIENAAVSMPDLVAPGSNSVVQGLDTLLFDPKPSICDFFDAYAENSQPQLAFSLFARLISESGLCKESKFTNVTVLLPSDDFLCSLFTEPQIMYLLSSRGTEDRKSVLANFLVDGMYGGNFGNQSVRVDTLQGYKIQLSTKMNGNELVVDEETCSDGANFLLSDGIVHYFPDQMSRTLDLPVFTPRKCLIAMNQTDFVDEIDFRKLSDLIDDPTLNQTILLGKDTDDDAFVDEANESFRTDDDSSEKDPPSQLHSFSQAKNNLLYQFIDGKIIPDHSQLLTSKFCSQSSLGHCQKLKVRVRGKSPILVNDRHLLYPERMEVANTYIYFVSDDYSIPGKLENSIMPVDRCAKTLQFMDKLKLLKRFKRNGGLGYTAFLPTSDAWSVLDLALDYLKSNPFQMALVLQSMMFNGLLYGDFTGETSLTNLDGEEVHFSRAQNQTQFITVEKVGHLPFSFNSEVLFRDGVAYPVNKVLFPESVTISTRQLLESVDSTGFLAILDSVNLSSLIDRNYSFLVPTTSTLDMNNITISSNPDYLREFALLHILPPESLRKLLACEAEIPTLLNGTYLSCHRIASGERMLQLVEGGEHEVRVLRKGLGTDGSGILLIDKPINPDWLDRSSPSIHLHLPLASVFVGIILGMIILASVVSCSVLFAVGGKSGVEGGDEIDSTHSDGTDPNSSPSEPPNPSNPSTTSPGSSSPTSEHSALAGRRVLGYGATGIRDGASAAAPQHLVKGPAAQLRQQAVVPGSFSERYSSHSKSAAIDLPGREA